jgi:DNA adenine methylase
MKPLFQWAGGKTYMVKRYKPLYPKNFDVYVDPFVGSGGMLIQALEANPQAACYINDANKYIIGIYEAIKNDWDAFDKKVSEIYDYFYTLPPTEVCNKTRKAAYCKLREEYNYDYSQWSKTEQAAVLYFLIRNCFKGVWHTSKKTGRFSQSCGFMNDDLQFYSSSFGFMSYVKLRPNLLEWHKALQTVHIQSGDWKNCTGLTNPNAWIYLDPPYRGGTIDYGQEGGWTDANQTELLEFTVLLTHATTEVWLSNRDTGDGFFDDSIQQNSYMVDTHKFASKFKLKATTGPDTQCTELLLIKKPRVDDK